MCDLQQEPADKGRCITISGMGVGAAFLKADLQGAKLNVLINTEIMKDQELKEEIETELERIFTA